MTHCSWNGNFTIVWNIFHISGSFFSSCCSFDSTHKHTIFPQIQIFISFHFATHTNTHTRTHFIIISLLMLNIFLLKHFTLNFAHSVFNLTVSHIITVLRIMALLKFMHILMNIVFSICIFSMFVYGFSPFELPLFLVINRWRIC